MSRTDWFTNARFGMFIHWGIYAIPAAGEWIYANRDWKDGEYQNLMKQFNPFDYDPAYWAELAKAAGMKYVVFTTKHHDGFCMFDSKYTDYKITNTPYGKDVTRMLAEAFRAAGLKIGFYHSCRTGRIRVMPTRRARNSCSTKSSIRPRRNSAGIF